MSSPFGRSLPARPDLAQQKKQAKELLAVLRCRRHRGTRARPRRAAGQAADRPRRRAVRARARIRLRELGSAQEPHRRARARSASPARAHARRLPSTRRNARATALRAAPRASRANQRAVVLASTRRRSSRCANDPAMVDVLLDFGADPNRRSEWWAGGIPRAVRPRPATPPTRLIAAGAIPDACAAAHLDRVDLLARMIAEDPRACTSAVAMDRRRSTSRSRAPWSICSSTPARTSTRETSIIARRRRSGCSTSTRGAGRYELARYLVERGASADIFLAAALGLTDACARC